MDYEQMAAVLTEALGRKIVFQNLSIAGHCKSLEKMGLPAYVVQHFESVVDGYQHGVMAGMTTASKDCRDKSPRARRVRTRSSGSTEPKKSK
jgi:hypothetical protein